MVGHMFIEVGKHKYWVECEGKGEPLVILHGFTGSTNTFRFLKQYLPHYQHIRIDLPGHGRTKATIFSIEECMDDIFIVCKKIGLNKVHLLGYSMGGRTALSFAKKYSTFLQSLIIESATPGIEEEEARKKRIKADEELSTFILENSLEAFVNYWEDIPLFSSHKNLPIPVKKAIRQERLAQTKEGLALSLRRMGTGVMPSLWNQLSTITCPVCIIVGESDKKFVQIGEKMISLLQNNEFHVVKNSGHAIHVEQSEIFGTIVSEFLKKRRM